MDVSAAYSHPYAFGRIWADRWIGYRPMHQMVEAWKCINSWSVKWDSSGPNWETYGFTYADFVCHHFDWQRVTEPNALTPLPCCLGLNRDHFSVQRFSASFTAYFSSCSCYLSSSPKPYPWYSTSCFYCLDYLQNLVIKCFLNLSLSQICFSPI